MFAEPISMDLNIFISVDDEVRDDNQFKSVEYYCLLLFCFAFVGLNYSSDAP